MLQHQIQRPPSKEVISKYNWLPIRFDSDGSVTRFICNEPKGSHAPRLTLTRSPDWKWYLMAEVSIPAWLFGTNTILPNQQDIFDFLYQLSFYVSEKAQRNFDAPSAKMRRVDFTNDFLIGRENIIPKIRNISKIIIPRFLRTVYNEKTVAFRNRAKRKGKIIKIYDKLSEIIDTKKHISNQDEIKDLLRLEVSLCSDYYISKLKKEYGLPDISAESVLRIEIAESEIQKARELTYFDVQPLEEDIKLHLLIANYGSKYAATLFGFLKLIENYGFDFCKFSFLGYPERTYRKHLKECKDAGVFP